jgi:hypothetical protein
MIDTKYMATLTPLKELISNTTLGDMDKILSKEPFQNIELGTFPIHCCMPYSATVIAYRLS